MGSGGRTGHWTYSPSHSLPPAFLPLCLLRCQWLTFLQDASCQCSSSLPRSTLHNSLHSWFLGWRQRHSPSGRHDVDSDGDGLADSIDDYDDNDGILDDHDNDDDGDGILDNDDDDDYDDDNDGIPDGEEDDDGDGIDNDEDDDDDGDGIDDDDDLSNEL